MALQYKINVLSALKEKGYSTYKIKKERLLSESTLQKLRNNEPIGWNNISILCSLLECQPNDFLEYIPEKSEEQK